MQLSNKLLFEQCAQYSLVCVLVKYYFLCNVHSEPVYTFFSHFNMSCHGWWNRNWTACYIVPYMPFIKHLITHQILVILGKKVLLRTKCHTQETSSRGKVSGCHPVSVPQHQ